MILLRCESRVVCDALYVLTVGSMFTLSTPDFCSRGCRNSMNISLISTGEQQREDTSRRQATTSNV